MHIREILDSKTVACSFEFFPPKTDESSLELYNTVKELDTLKPAYVSITYGAGGSTRSLTHDLVVKLSREMRFPVVSHLTCVGSERDETEKILNRYVECGIFNIMALRGDIPSETLPQIQNGFEHAVDLVSFIRTKFPSMGIGVAGYPEGHHETPNRMKEMDYLKEKVDAGADYICTQLFYDNHDFFDFRERCTTAGITVPIVAGIMPVTSRKNMLRMSELALGTRIPGKLMRALARARSTEQVRNVGVHWATEQVRDLIDGGVSGIHFYTLNRSNATQKIYENLGVVTSADFETPPTYP
ncbi:methylenetetrahydrofolate reductase [NAD(P)H] [Myxococcota bacterium]|nr:methylenetetrahydrofolate reductase [NAD(P)H] [Myxococcota bacterium]